MQGEKDTNEILDYILFQFSSFQSRFEALICSKGSTEKVASGLLENLLIHLHAEDSFNPSKNDIFKLQLSENFRGSSWFTKSTLIRFLKIVNMPEVLKKATAVQNELNQLEETRKFHLSLYSKDAGDKFGSSQADCNYLREVETVHKGTSQTFTSDATKNELLRALELRLAVLKEDLTATFNQVLGSSCTKAQMCDLAAFVEHFGATDLRAAMLRYIDLNVNDALVDGSNKQPLVSCNSGDCIGSEEKSRQWQLSNSQEVIKNRISPAKIAEAERQSSSDSEDVSDPGDEENTFTERSRPIVRSIRSASPRRSASPMRRIQIGRSGSRRSTALTIKSLSFFPARDKTFLNRETDEHNSGDESFDPQPKRSENAVLRMSVQDRINLFESKQRDQTSDALKKNTSTDPSVCTKKSVLRRWSAGMGDTCTLVPQGNTSDGKNETAFNSVSSHPDSVVEASEALNSSKPTENLSTTSSLEEKNSQSSLKPNSADAVVIQLKEADKVVVSSAEWTQQKEAELNQLVNMMGTKPAIFNNPTAGAGKIQNQEFTREQKGDFYNQYKAKRDEKLRAENAGKQTEKEAKFKVMRETLDQRKAEMASRVTTIARKKDPYIPSQKPRRNSSPTLPLKKDSTNSVASRKASPKTPSALPTTRNSSPRTTGTSTTKKISSGASGPVSSTISSRQKPQPTPSPTRSMPRFEKPKQTQGTKGVINDSKHTIKHQDEKKQKMAIKSKKTLNAKASTPSQDEAEQTPVKPGFYSKGSKKSSVVPLESKPFLKKGTGIGSGVAPISMKTKISQPEDFSKNGECVIQNEQEMVIQKEEKKDPLQEGNSTQPSSDFDTSSQDPVDASLPEIDIIDQNFEKAEMSDNIVADDAENSISLSAEFPSTEIHADDDLGISSIAWVEDENQLRRVSFENGSNAATPANAAPLALSSPRIRHSLSQMLQADISEGDVVEWGNAENPPALVYQKDAPRGLKRLLKFARKNKGEANAAGVSSPPIISEGEEDSEEPKVINKKNSDPLSKKAATKGKAGLHRNLLNESYDGGNSSKRSSLHLANHDALSASMSGLPHGSYKLRDVSSTSAKASRSFFSLSTFRSSKSNEAKQR